MADGVILTTTVGVTLSLDRYNELIGYERAMKAVARPCCLCEQPAAAEWLGNLYCLKHDAEGAAAYHASKQGHTEEP